MRARGRGRRDSRACDDVAELLRLHARATTTGARSTSSLRSTATRPWRGPPATGRSRRCGRLCRAPACRDAGGHAGPAVRRCRPAARRRSRAGSLFAAWTAAAAVVASAVLVGVSPGPPAGASTAPPVPPGPGWLGLGRLPTHGAHPRGQATSSGYAEDLVPLEQQRWPGLTVVHLGCPGATTRDHARRRREVPLRRGEPAAGGGGVPPGPPDAPSS